MCPPSLWTVEDLLFDRGIDLERYIIERYIIDRKTSKKRRAAALAEWRPIAS